MKIVIQYDSKKGRGVYADLLIKPGEIIEVCHLLIMEEHQMGDALEGYVYQYDVKRVALALGNGSLYNHSGDSNADYYFNKKKKLLYIEAKRKITPGEEILIDYGYSEEDLKKFSIQ